MKKVIFYQKGIDETVLNSELTFLIDDKTDANTVVGNFIGYVEFFKDSNAKLFNFSKPIILIVQNEKDETIINTGLAFAQLQQKCKLQWTKKGRTKFKNNIATCIKASQYKTKVFTEKDFEELNERLG